MREVGWFPWNGSKTWLLGDLELVLRRWNGQGRFIDPFVGGGSVSRLARRLFPQSPQVVADANRWLVAAYAQARSSVSYRLPSNVSDVAYWRGLTDTNFGDLNLAERATRFAVCLHSAWGNRWETRSTGEFRSTVNRRWCSEEFLGRKVEAMFHGHWLRQSDTAEAGDWTTTVQQARKGDLVYLDPPYPEALGYGNQHWTFEDALDLLDWAVDAEHDGVSVVVSNMNALRRLYERAGLRCVTVNGPTAMKTRRLRREVLAHNLKEVQGA